MRMSWLSMLPIVLCVGCVGGSPGVVNSNSPAVADTPAKTGYQSLSCQAANEALVSAVTEQKQLNGLGPYNMTIVEFSAGWEAIAYGYSGASLDVYLASKGSTDLTSWQLVSHNGDEHWDVAGLPSDLLPQAKSAVNLARSCTMGG